MRLSRGSFLKLHRITLSILIVFFAFNLADAQKTKAKPKNQKQSSETLVLSISKDGRSIIDQNGKIVAQFVNGTRIQTSPKGGNAAIQKMPGCLRCTNECLIYDSNGRCVRWYRSCTWDFDCRSDRATEQLSMVSKPTPFLLNGKPVPVRTAPKTFEEGIVQPYRWVVWSDWTADANWDEEKNGRELIEAPSGWQVCTVFYTETTKNGHDAWANYEPTSWYTNDSQSPDRFRAVWIQIHAQGNLNPFDRRGSKMVLRDIGITMIPAEADNFQRYQAGCAMPPHD